MVPGKTLDYTFNLMKEIVPTGEAIVSVVYAGRCLEGAKVEIFDRKETTTLLQSFTTTSSVCNTTFTTVNLGVDYRAIVTPPIGSYLCSGDFDSSCSATFAVVASKVTIVQCILVVITQAPMTFSPTQKPTIPPTSKPTKKPTMQPVDLPTPKPTNTPTMQPVNLPTPKPTTKPTKLPVDPPTPTPTPVSPLQNESATIPPTKSPVAAPTPKPTKGLQTTQPTDAPVKVEKSTKSPTKFRSPGSAKSKSTRPTKTPVSVGVTISNDYTVKIKGK
jgi:hypothetical protein